MNIIISICSKSSILEVFLIVKTIFKLLCLLAPFLITIVSSVGLFKIIISGKEEDLKEYGKVFVRRIIAGLVIFFIPAIITYTINNILGAKDVDFIACFESASKEKVKELKEQEEAETEAERIKKEIEDKDILRRAYEAEQKIKASKKESFEEWKKTHGVGTTKLSYSRAIEIPSDVLRNASHSDLSVVITDDKGNVLASRKPLDLREGGSTTKVFTGYAAVKLLDPVNDKVISTSYAQNMPYMGDPDVKVGQVLSVSQAATKDFPGSSNITTANIAIAIGKKYRHSPNDAQAYFDGIEEINNLIKSVGCTNTKIPSSSGVNYNYKTKKWVFDTNGYAEGEDGISANDLALITIAAMQDENFSKGINYGNNGICPPPNSNTFYIKSGTQKFCHGVWGFNHNGNRYYIVILGVNCNKGDNKCRIFEDLYNWAVTSVIK